ncbi:hypothetical protein LTR97_002776 [Elasticomyces elasticus]|uniref:Apple domain-containing protein n=1 Tax=Elasticomyces elasticus TaxID=574655 RepID=A0AAN8A3J9_9PEZI|nr:hypothetical protein LTR97_002776 [Elasticomyces elasticus]
MANMLPVGAMELSVPEHGVAQTDRYPYQQARSEQPPPYSGLPGPSSKTQPQRVWGMSPLWFGIFIAAVTALIVGAAVGGSAANSVKDAQQRVTTTRTFSHATATAAPFVDYVAAAPSTVENTPLVCPDEDGKTYVTVQNEIFELSCTSILAQGDVGCIVAYTFQDCIEACASLYSNQSSSVCTAITYNSNMASAGTAAPYRYGNCWLKQQELASNASNTDDNSISASLRTS